MCDCQEMSFQSLIARASMRTMEHIEKIKEDAEKSFGLEVHMDDPLFKELQSFVVEEEDVLQQLQKLTNEFMESVTTFSKKDSTEFTENMRTLVKSRGSEEQKYRINSQLDEYKNIRDETANGAENTESVGSWLIVEIQTNVLNAIEREFGKHERIRSKFWKLKELRRHMANLSKIASIDKKSKGELTDVMKDCSDVEKELVDELLQKKENGVALIDGIWNEYCRIEAEYFSKMNDAYLEPTTPRPKATTISVSSKPAEWLGSPVIGEDEDDTESIPN